MNLNLRTIIVLVVLITSLAISYIDVFVQIALILISVLLLFSVNSTKHRRERVWHRLKGLSFILLMILITQIIFRREGEPIFEWHIIKITEMGIRYGISISLRYILIIIIASLLLDISYSEYLKAFQAWKFPPKLTFLLTSTIHFLHLFQRNLKNIQENLMIRGIKLKSLPLKKKLNAFITIILPLLGKSLSEIQFRSAALELKGFGVSASRTSVYEDKLKWYDYLIQLASILIFAIVIIYKII